MVGQHKIQPTLLGADSDGARGLPAVKQREFTRDWRSDRLQLQNAQALANSSRAAALRKKADRDGGADQIESLAPPRKTMDDNDGGGHEYKLVAARPQQL